MGEVLAFVSVKGGVGKTTLALETASSLANDFEKKVLLVDANFSAPNLGLYLDLTDEVTLHDALLGVGLHNAIYESHGFDVAPASFDYNHEVDIYRLEKVLFKMRNKYDFIILDSAPNYAELIPVIASADRIFIVTTPDRITLATSMKAAKLAKQKKTPIEGMIINKIRHPDYELELKDIEESSELPVLARIRDNKKIAEAIFHKKPITVYDRNNEISREVRRFSSALCGTPEEPAGFFQRILPFKNLIGKDIGKEKVNRQLLREKFYESQL